MPPLDLDVDPRASRLPRQWLAVTGVLLLVAGQLLLVIAPATTFLPDWLVQAVQPMWPEGGPALLAIGAFVCGGFMLQLAPCRRPEAWPTIAPPTCPVTRQRRAGTTFGVGATILLSTLLVQLRTNVQARPPYALFVLAVVLAILAATSLDGHRARGAVRKPRRTWPSLALEGAAVAGAAAMFVGSVVADAGDWHYSAIGDEYYFYEEAAAQASGEHRPNLFSQQGAYDIIPEASSALCGSFMRVIGQDARGWKISSAMPVVPALILLFFLARLLWGRLVAVVAVWLFASSHYLLAYSHTGYPNIEAVFPAVASILALVIALRRGQRLWLLVAGLLAGVGWYTYYTGRATIAILVAATALTVHRRDWLRIGVWILAGFVLCVSPMIAVSGHRVLAAMTEQTGFGPTSEPAANRHLLPIWNTGRSLLAFNYNTQTGPYLYGSLAEPMTAIWFVAGLASLIGSRRDLGSRLLLAWFGVGLLVAGTISKYDYVSVSRLNFLIPVVSLCAGIGLATILSVLREAAGIRSPRFRAGAAGFIVALAIASNYYRFRVQTRTHVPSSVDAIVVREATSGPCIRASLPPVIVDRELSGALFPAFSAMRLGFAPQWALYSTGRRWIETAGNRCVIFRSPDDADVGGLLAAIAQRWPRLNPMAATDDTGLARILVIHPLVH